MKMISTITTTTLTGLARKGYIPKGPNSFNNTGISLQEQIKDLFNLQILFPS